MKKKAILILTAILAILVIAAISVSAQGGGWEYYACGTVLDYEDAPSATIDPDGYWNLKVTGKKIYLDMYYLETNLDESIENSPEDSVDMFHFWMIGQPMAFIESEDKLEIFAVMKIEKDQATYDGTYVNRVWKNYVWWTFDFDAQTVHMDVYPGEDIETQYFIDNPDEFDWDRYGVITSFNYPGAS